MSELDINGQLHNPHLQHPQQQQQQQQQQEIGARGGWEGAAVAPSNDAAGELAFTGSA